MSPPCISIGSRRPRRVSGSFSGPTVWTASRCRKVDLRSASSVSVMYGSAAPRNTSPCRSRLAMCWMYDPSLRASASGIECISSMVSSTRLPTRAAALARSPRSRLRSSPYPVRLGSDSSANDTPADKPPAPRLTPDTDRLAGSPWACTHALCARYTALCVSSIRFPSVPETERTSHPRSAWAASSISFNKTVLPKPRGASSTFAPPSLAGSPASRAHTSRISSSLPTKHGGVLPNPGVNGNESGISPSSGK